MITVCCNCCIKYVQSTLFPSSILFEQKYFLKVFFRMKQKGKPIKGKIKQFADIFNCYCCCYHLVSTSEDEMKISSYLFLNVSIAVTTVHFLREEKFAGLTLNEVTIMM